MEPYGFPVAMPASRKFAAEGATFRRAFSCAPTCSPSRAALLTGMSPHSAGMIGLAHRGFALHDSRQHLAHFLSEHGYQTVLAGHQHVTSGDPRDLGYTTVLDSGDSHAAVVAPRAADFLRERGAQELPFFLDVGFDEAHRPFHAAAEGSDRYVAVLPGMPDNATTRHDVAQFHASLQELDRGVGTVLDALEASGHADKTIVILTTDHGPAFPGMKATLTDGGIGVGLMMRLPGQKRSGFVIDALVSQIDLFPTICDLAGLEQPQWLQGVSLRPVLDDTANQVRDDVFAEITFHAAYEPQRAIRTPRWTYIRRFDNRVFPVLPNIDASPVLDLMLANGFAERNVATTMLYDNLFDPQQRQNLAGSTQTSAVESDLGGRLDAWMRATNDPLLDGPVPLPQGAIVNRVSDRSPDGPLVDSDYR